MESGFKIIMPKGALGKSSADSILDSFLRMFAEQNKNDPHDWSEKYGCEIDNEKVMMHPFCWCEKDDCLYCNNTLPNFWYKPLDFKVWWYKYIGRGTETNKTLTIAEFEQMINDCLIVKPNNQ